MQFAKSAERRAHARTKVTLPARVLLANRRECACTVIDVSPGGIALLSRDRGAVGEAAVVYVADAGRLQGTITRHFEGGFAMRLEGASRAAEALARRFAAA